MLSIPVLVNTLLADLQKIQNISCRIILLADGRTHIQDMHDDLKLMKLDMRRDVHIAQLCHKNVYFEGEASLSELF